MYVMQMNRVQDQQLRAEEDRRREEERLAEQLRHERFMEMMMVMMELKVHNKKIKKSVFDESSEEE